jgi:hypothetical protein
MEYTTMPQVLEKLKDRFAEAKDYEKYIKPKIKRGELLTGGETHE